MVAVWSEQVEDLYGGGAGGAEPMRFAGVELGHLAGAEGELAVSENEAELAGEDAEPFVGVVGYELWFAGREDLFEDLDPAWALGQGHQDAASLPAEWLQVHARVAGRR